MVDSPDPNADNNKLQGVARVNANQTWAVGEVANPAATMIQRYTAQ